MWSRSCGASFLSRGSRTPRGERVRLPLSESAGPRVGPAQPRLAAVAVVVGLAATRLDQHEGDQIDNGEQGDVPPGLDGLEVVEQLAGLKDRDQERGYQD